MGFFSGFSNIFSSGHKGFSSKNPWEMDVGRKKDRVGKGGEIWKGGDIQEFVLGTKETDAQREARLSSEENLRLQEEQLAKQEAELEAISARASKAVAEERRRRARRSGRSSTILTSFNQNFSNNTQSFRSTTGA